MIEHCLKILKTSEEQAEEQSIAKVEEFKSHMKKVMRVCENEKDVNGETDSVNILADQQEQLLNERVLELEDELIEIEMNLQVNLNTSVSTFGKNLDAVTNEMRQKVTNFISGVTEAVSKFFDAFSEEAKKKMEQFTKLMEEEGEEID
jgi:hypothetical protein